MQGEGEGAEEAAAEDGNQTLRQPDRVDLRGGRGDLTCAFAEAFMHVNKLYQSPLLSLEFINKDFYTPALNSATFPRQTQKKKKKNFSFRSILEKILFATISWWKQSQN